MKKSAFQLSVSVMVFLAFVLPSYSISSAQTSGDMSTMEMAVSGVVETFYGAVSRGDLDKIFTLLPVRITHKIARSTSPGALEGNLGDRIGLASAVARKEIKLEYTDMKVNILKTEGYVVHVLATYRLKMENNREKYSAGFRDYIQMKKTGERWLIETIRDRTSNADEMKKK